MLKPYHIPRVTVLGAADVITNGIFGPIIEIGSPLTGTTHSMLDI